MIRRRFTVYTWTDDDGIAHSLKPSGFITTCGADVPTDYDGGMPGWPPPPKRDYEPKTVTCISCAGAKDGWGA